MFTVNGREEPKKAWSFAIDKSEVTRKRWTRMGRSLNFGFWEADAEPNFLPDAVIALNEGQRRGDPVLRMERRVFRPLGIEKVKMAMSLERGGQQCLR